MHGHWTLNTSTHNLIMLRKLNLEMVAVKKFERWIIQIIAYEVADHSLKAFPCSANRIAQVAQLVRIRNSHSLTNLMTNIFSWSWVNTSLVLNPYLLPTYHSICNLEPV